MGLVVGVNDEEFMVWANEVKNQFVAMTETMIKIADNIRKEVQTKWVPLETGRLSRSFRWTVLTDNTRMKVLQVQMSALNPKTGYNYAWIQHEAHFNHPSTDLGFYTYTRRTGPDQTGYEIKDWGLPMELTRHHGFRRYLYEGIMHSKDESFELIEHDYLSLFYGGHIV